MQVKVTSRGAKGLIERLRRIASPVWTSRAVTADMQDYKQLLIKSVFEVYATRETRAHFRALITTKRATKITRTAVLRVAYEAHPLSHFQVKQTAITTGNRRKRVVSKKGRGYRQSLTSQTTTSTLVKVRKKGRLKLVHGKRGYKGFLQDEHDMIFERKQRRTWFGKTRAPISRLYGLSFSQMAASRYVQDRMRPWYNDNSHYTTELDKL